MEETHSTATTLPSASTSSNILSDDGILRKTRHQNGQEHPSIKQSFAESNETAREPTSSGILDKDTIEIVLQFLPPDDHPEGRKIRNALIVNGKTLRVGTLRTNTIPALLASFAGQSPDQVLERLAQYVAECQQQIGAVQRLIAQKASKQQRIGSLASTMKNTKPTLLDTSSQQETHNMPNSPFTSTSALSVQVKDGAGQSEPEPTETASEKEMPLQLTLFS